MSGEFNGFNSRFKSNSRLLIAIIVWPIEWHYVLLNLRIRYQRWQSFLALWISSFPSSDPAQSTAHLWRNLPKPGDTRWLSRDTSISVIDTCYEAIGTVLYKIAHDYSQKTDSFIHSFKILKSRWPHQPRVAAFQGAVEKT